MRTLVLVLLALSSTASADPEPRGPGGAPCPDGETLSATYKGPLGTMRVFGGKWEINGDFVFGVVTGYIKMTFTKDPKGGCPIPSGTFVSKSPAKSPNTGWDRRTGTISIKGEDRKITVEFVAPGYTTDVYVGYATR